MRHIPAPVYLTSDAGSLPTQTVWVKAFDALPDAANAKATADRHRTALTYVRNCTIPETLPPASGLI